MLSAHIDHVGIGAAINGDSIYNGAMDDGSGTALVLDVATNLKAHPEKLQRSIIFLLVTAEEKGLLGSKYYATHPTVPIKSIVADINVDMFLPIVPLKILTIQGLAESDLGARADAITQSLGVTPQPDPEPLRNVFIRSDQYSFIKQGVPALKMDVSYAPGSPEQKVFKDWLTNRYHAPSDDVNQPVESIGRCPLRGNHASPFDRNRKHTGASPMECRFLLPPLRHQLNCVRARR